MPLLSPTAIKTVLKESGKGQSELLKLLEANGLGPEECIEELGTAIRGADNSATRLRGLETALKLNGMFPKEGASEIPSVTIIINDSQHIVNPILIPRT